MQAVNIVIHKDELSKEELEQLQKQLQKATVEEMSSEEEEGREDVPTSLIQQHKHFQ
jgi:molybdate-binding protein